MKHLLAMLVVTVGVIAGVSIAVVSVDVPLLIASAASVSQHSFILQLDWLQSLIERIDQFLESLVDLMRTLQELFGGGGG